VVEILFDSGTTVKAGQPLVRLDTSKENADLKATLAQIPAAKTDFDRKRQLLKSGAVGQSDVDDAQSKYDTLVAQSGSLKATIARRTLAAPFGGILGIRKVNLGQYLQPGDQVANLQDLSVMRMRFLVAQKDYGKIKIDQPIEATFDAYPGEVFKGRVSTIEPSVKFQSGIIPIQAEIPNSDAKLLPGMYGSLDVLLPDHSKKVVVPASAITFNLYGESVYVVDSAAGTVQQVTVVTGATRNNAVVIEKGLKAGDQVVVAGQLKLSNGSKVKVVEGQTLPEMTAIPVQ
jgi:membrane fusion protein (multidrug efflux system)